MTSPLLEVNNLSVYFDVGGVEIQAVKGISFSIDNAETMALVGGSGSGKTVTALSILQLLSPGSTSKISGSVKFRGKELNNGQNGDLRRIRGQKISIIFQEPMTSLNPLHNVEKQIAEILLVHRGLRSRTARIRTLELLDLVGIVQPEKRLTAFPHQLSGGERQRVMIAMALANEPELLIADEPTTSLDVTIQAQILKLLQDLQTKFSMGILLITHDVQIVRKMANYIAVMFEGEIVEQDHAGNVFRTPQHNYTKKLLTTEIPGRKYDAKARENPDSLISVKNLKVQFPIKTGFFRRTLAHVRVVEDASFIIRTGSTLGVVGESGSGKTSLGLALLRLIRSEGEIVFKGKNIQGWSFKRLRPLRRKIQIVFQDPFSSLSPRLSIAQIIEEGLLIHRIGASYEERRQLIINVLEEVGLSAVTMDRYPHEFSGGQRQRVAIARAIVLKPDMLVLDEPTSALDVSVQKQIVELLRVLQETYYLAYIFISHDLRVLRALADEILVMRDGRIVEQGNAIDFFDNPKTSYARALLAAAFDFEAVKFDNGDN